MIGLRLVALATGLAAVLHGQALQRKDFTIGGVVSTGFRDTLFSRGIIPAAEVTYSFSDRFYIRGTGGRMQRTVRPEGFEATQTHQFVGASFGVQFRLQQSLSPFAEGGLVGSWGSGIESLLGSDGKPLVQNPADFHLLSLDCAGGIRYVRTPSSRWGVSSFYRILVPLYRSESIPLPLSILNTSGIQDRAGVSFFLRF